MLHSYGRPTMSVLAVREAEIYSIDEQKHETQTSQI